MLEATAELLATLLEVDQGLDAQQLEWQIRAQRRWVSPVVQDGGEVYRLGAVWVEQDAWAGEEAGAVDGVALALGGED